MTTSDNVLYIKRKTTERMFKDNLGNREAATELVTRLQAYYHEKGQRWVKVWLEPSTLASGSRMYSVRSNIIFKVPRG